MPTARASVRHVQQLTGHRADNDPLNAVYIQLAGGNRPRTTLLLDVAFLVQPVASDRVAPAAGESARSITSHTHTHTRAYTKAAS